VVEEATREKYPDEPDGTRRFGCYSALGNVFRCASFSEGTRMIANAPIKTTEEAKL